LCEIAAEQMSSDPEAAGPVNSSYMPSKLMSLD
jgi:hypothetical protein